MNLAIAKHAEGVSRHESRRLFHLPPYEPQGLWAFIPPNNGYDLRVRATRTLDRSLDLPEVLPKLLAEGGLLCTYPITMRVSYNP